MQFAFSKSSIKKGKRLGKFSMLATLALKISLCLAPSPAAPYDFRSGDMLPH